MNGRDPLTLEERELARLLGRNVLLVPDGVPSEPGLMALLT